MSFNISSKLMNGFLIEKNINSSQILLLVALHKRMSSDFANIRAKYGDPKQAFDVNDLASKDPIKQFDAWFQAARQHSAIKEANAMCLSTATKEGKPSSRMVLLKDFSDKGFTFFTNYSSRKSRELEQNPHASLLFYWDQMSRQVRIEGRVVKLDREKSIEYFCKRPFDSRISAYISEQSKVIPNRQHLIDAQVEAAEKFGSAAHGQHVPTPENWGGYLLMPDEIEFWQGNDIRLHDRLRFRRCSREGKSLPLTNENNRTDFVEGENGWIIERLAP